MSSPNVLIGDPLFIFPGFPIKLGMTKNSCFAEVNYNIAQKETNFETNLNYNFFGLKQ